MPTIQVLLVFDSVSQFDSGDLNQPFPFMKAEQKTILDLLAKLST